MPSITKKSTKYITLGIRSYFSSYTGLQRAVWTGIIFDFLNSILTSLFPFLAIYFVNELTLSVGSAGILISCYGIGTLFGAFLGGKLSDKFSPKVISWQCILVEALCYAALVFTHSFAILTVILFVIGVATYGFLTANYTWVLSYCKHDESQKFKALGILAVVSNLAMGLAAIFIGLSGTVGFHVLFIVSSSLLALLGLALFLIKNPVIKNNSSTATTTANTEKVKAPSHIQKSNNKMVLYVALTCILLMGAIVAQLNSNYPLYIQNTFSQMGLKSISILFTINSLFIVFFQAPVVHFFKDANKLRLVGVGSALLGIGMFLLIFSMSYWIAIVACIVFSVGEMFFFSAVQLVCYESGDADKKGQSMGLFRIFYGASRIIGPAVGGFFYHLNPAILWGLCGFLGFFCWIMCEFVKMRIIKD